jgi:uncharacterized caspase-like protein
MVPNSAPRLALVIGNANYGKLDNPGKDADLIAEKLRQVGFEVTEKADRDLKDMTDDIEDFARKISQRGLETVALLYYAGHGLESDSINYLVPVNADIKRRSDVAGNAECQACCRKDVGRRQPIQYSNSRCLPRQPLSTGFRDARHCWSSTDGSRLR